MNTTRTTMMTAAVALLSACGAGVAMEEHGGTLGTGTVCFAPDGGGQCPQDLAWAEGEAQHLLVVAGLLAPGAHLPARVEVQPHDVWTEWGAEVLGIAPVTAIKVGPHLTVLVHEALHIVDFARGRLDTVWHAQWHERGYGTLQTIYAVALWDHRGRPDPWGQAEYDGKMVYTHAYAHADADHVCDEYAGMPLPMLRAVLADADAHAMLNLAREMLCNRTTPAL